MAVGDTLGQGSSCWPQSGAGSSFWAELADGLPLNRETATRLIRCDEQDLPYLLMAAARVKERFHPGVITYSRKVFLPLTNLCRNACGYCTFRRNPGDADAYTMQPDTVLAIATAGEKLGCREALFSLGDKPELVFEEMREGLRGLGYKSSLHYLEAMCMLVLRETKLLPHANAGVMNVEWLERLGAVCPSLGLMLESISTTLPPAVHQHAPDKDPTARLRMLETAGKLGIPFTTGLLIGIGESAEDRVQTLFAICELHRRYGHIQEVIVQNFQPKPGTPMAHWPAPSAGDMLRTLAVARLVLGRMNLQAPPNLAGSHYQNWLKAGINDYGGISPLTPDFINPEWPWPHLSELERRTAATGQLLRERLCIYPEYIQSRMAKNGVLAERLRASARSCGTEYKSRLIDASLANSEKRGCQFA